MEACERAVREVGVVRLQTPHLALVDVGEGYLIRVGGAPRREFVDWRYGPRLPWATGRPGFLARVLSRLPPPPPTGYDPYRRVFTHLQEGPWLASPFLEEAAPLTYLFSHLPLAPECPACRRPLTLAPWDFQALQVVTTGTGIGVRATCGFCRDQVVVEMREARPTLRVALGIVTSRGVLQGQAPEASRALDEKGGEEGFLAYLGRQEIPLGGLSARMRAGLIISLDEAAEGEALEAEWKRSEEIAGIFDGELSTVPGFQAFKDRLSKGLNARDD